jgi:hypothetical protein
MCADYKPSGAPEYCRCTGHKPIGDSEHVY